MYKTEDHGLHSVSNSESELFAQLLSKEPSKEDLFR